MNKIFFQMGFKNVEVKKEKIIIEGLASTPTPDRYNDIVEPKAFEEGIKNYLNNPIILLQHNPEKVIGKMIDYRIDEKGLWIKAEILYNEDNIFDKIQKGLVRGFSIGFIPKLFEYQDKDGNIVEGEAIFDKDVIRIIKELDLVEISVVNIPANPETLFTLSKALTKFFEEILSKEGTDLRELQEEQEEKEEDKEEQKEEKQEEQEKEVEEKKEEEEKQEEEQEEKKENEEEDKEEDKEENEEEEVEEDSDIMFRMEHLETLVDEDEKNWKIKVKIPSLYSLDVDFGNWDATGAINRILKKYGYDGLKEYCLYLDKDKDPNTKGAYKFPVVDIIDGKPKIVAKAVSTARAYINGARGVRIKESIKKVVIPKLDKLQKIIDKAKEQLKNKSSGNIEQKSLEIKALQEKIQVLEEKNLKLEKENQELKQVNEALVKNLEIIEEKLSKIPVNKVEIFYKEEKKNIFEEAKKGKTITFEI